MHRGRAWAPAGFGAGTWSQGYLWPAGLWARCPEDPATEPQRAHGHSPCDGRREEWGTGTRGGALGPGGHSLRLGRVSGGQPSGGSAALRLGCVLRVTQVRDPPHQRGEGRDQSRPEAEQRHSQGQADRWAGTEKLPRNGEDGEDAGLALASRWAAGGYSASPGTGRLAGGSRGIQGP